MKYFLDFFRQDLENEGYFFVCILLLNYQMNPRRQLQKNLYFYPCNNHDIILNDNMAIMF